MSSGSTSTEPAEKSWPCCDHCTHKKDKRTGHVNPCAEPGCQVSQVCPVCGQSVVAADDGTSVHVFSGYTGAVHRTVVE